MTHELLTVPNDTDITAPEVCALLPQLAALNLGLPLTVSWTTPAINAVPKSGRLRPAYRAKYVFCRRLLPTSI
jgi:hypothetical protein